MNYIPIYTKHIYNYMNETTKMTIKRMHNIKKCTLNFQNSATKTY